MKISVRTLEGVTFDIEVTPRDTIGDVKKKIETAQGANAYPALQQQLIHEGNDLKDETTLEENKVAENSSVLLMLTGALQPSANIPAAILAPTAPVESLPSSIFESVPSPTSAPASFSFEKDALIQELKDLFRDTSVRFKRPNLGAGSGDGEDVVPSEVYQTAQVMAVAESQALQQTIQQLIKQNPQLERLAKENRAEFHRQIVDDLQVSWEMMTLSWRIDDIFSDPNIRAFTHEECEVMERLQALGFSEERALEAYLVCDGNMELAANYLLDHMDEPEFLVDLGTLRQTCFDLSSAQPSATIPVATSAPTAPVEPLPSSDTEFVPLPNSAPDVSVMVAFGMKVLESSGVSSNLATGDDSEDMIQLFLDTGEGYWERETVARAVRMLRDHPVKAQVCLYTARPGEGAGSRDTDYMVPCEVYNAIQVIAEPESQVLQQTIQQLVKQNPRLERLAKVNRAEFCRQIIGYPQVSKEMERLFERINDSFDNARAFTREERKAMGRLQALGFSEERALEAYLVCDGDAELAGNYLLDYCQMEETELPVDSGTLCQAYFDEVAPESWSRKGKRSEKKKRERGF